MILRSSSGRQGFSLLEMVIALAIGMLLLGALYASLMGQIRVSQAGRNTLEEAALVRAIFTRISNDIASQVGPYDPRMVNDPSNPNSQLSATATGTTTTTGTASSSTMANGATTSTAPTPVVTYNIGLYGTATMLQLSNYRVQAAPPGVITGSIDPNAEVVSDLRRVTYWLMQTGNETTGLARREFRQATNDAINEDPTMFPDQMQMLIAKEVSNITFEYYDGTTWEQQWDGTQVNTNLDAATLTVAPIGPPLAIRITLTLRKSSNPGASQQDPTNDQGPTYQHVIALTAANFTNPNPNQ